MRTAVDHDLAHHADAYDAARELRREDFDDPTNSPSTPMNINESTNELLASAPVKIFADGTAVPASDPRTDHVAVLFPDGWMVSTSLVSDDGEEFDDSDDAVTAASKTDLLGFTDWTNAPLDDVLLRHVIRHDRYSPAIDKNLFPNFPDSGWIRSDITPWSQDRAFCVYLDFGFVNDVPRYYSGFGLAARRARQ